MKKSSLRPLAFLVLPLIAGSCATTKAYRHKNGSITITERGWGATPGNYWITGATPGRLTIGEDLTVFRRGSMQIVNNVDYAVPLKCTGFVDATEAKRIEVRLVETQGGSRSQAWCNGRHKLVDENAPKPFYHWLIP